MSLIVLNFAFMKIDRSIWMFGMLSIFLAFAPFFPEPHLIGKIEWMIGGAVGMKPMDYFDTFLHGAPIIVFLFLLGINLGKKIKEPKIEKIKKHSSHKKGIAA